MNVKKCMCWCSSIIGWHKLFIIYLYRSAVAKTCVLNMDLFIYFLWNVLKQTTENSVYTTEKFYIYIYTSERDNKKSCHMDCGRTMCMSAMQTHCKLTKTQYFANCWYVVCLTARNHCFTVYCVVYLFFAWMHFVIETTESCHQELSEIYNSECFECIAFIDLNLLFHCMRNRHLVNCAHVSVSVCLFHIVKLF